MKSTILRVGKGIFDSRKPGKQKKPRKNRELQHTNWYRFLQAMEDVMKAKELFSLNNFYMPG